MQSRAGYHPSVALLGRRCVAGCVLGKHFVSDSLSVRAVYVLGALPNHTIPMYCISRRSTRSSVDCVGGDANDEDAAAAAAFSTTSDDYF